MKLAAIVVCLVLWTWASWKLSAMIVKGIMMEEIIVNQMRQQYMRAPDVRVVWKGFFLRIGSLIILLAIGMFVASRFL